MKKTLPFCRRLIMSLFLFTIAASSWAYDFEVDGIYYNKTSDSTVEVTFGSTYFNISDINIPQKVTEGGNVYTVTAISQSAFTECANLKSVTIPNSVTVIGSYAFAWCYNLTIITIPNSVTTIGEHAFDCCSNLTSITIPSSVTTIGKAAFSNCSQLIEINVDEGNANYSSQDGILFNKAKTKLIQVGGAFSGSYAIPNSVTTIDAYAFNSCDGLTSITIPNSVTTIGEYAFSACEGLTSVTIPNSVTSIGKNAFKYCQSLEYIEFYSSHALSYLKELDGYGYDCTVYVRYTDLETAKLYYNGELLPMERFYPEIIEKTANTIKFKVTEGGKPGAPVVGLAVCKLSINGTEMNVDDAVYLIQCQEPYQENEVYIQYYTYMEIVSTAPGSIPKRIIYDYYDLYFTLTSGKPEFSIKNENTKQGQVSLQVGLNCDISTTDYEVGCVLDSTFYKADTDSIVVINKLTPGKQYTITPYVKYKDKTYLGSSRTYTTESIEFYCGESRTQSSFSVKPRINNSDGTALPDVLGVEFNGTYYSYGEPTWIKITGLTPNNSYSYRPYAEFNGEKIYGSWKSITTRGVSPYIGKTEEGVTTLSIFGSCQLDDATLDKAYFEGYEDQGRELHLSGLNPNTNYSFTFYVKTQEGSTESVTKSFTTAKLQWETLPAEATSNTVALICAKTNIADEETGTGFEWRRYDAPDLVPSTKAPCPVVDGILTGALRNLSANTYYKFRPYYTSATGKTYYGDWLAFGTADAYVYFDPTVRTYEASTVSHNSAKLKGYAIAGSDDIVEQGFEYWTTGRSTAPLRILATNAEGDNVQSVIAAGQWMNVTLENLQPGTTYTYRAYVKTAKTTTYGEEQSFTTMEVSGIEDMEIGEGVTITAIYTLDGRRIASPQPGVNIVHYSDGSVRKVIVK